MTDAYSLRGALFLATGQYQKAVEDYSKCAQDNPNAGMFYFRRAEAYEMLGKSDRARLDRQRSVELGYKPAQS